MLNFADEGAVVALLQAVKQCIIFWSTSSMGRMHDGGAVTGADATLIF